MKKSSLKTIFLISLTALILLNFYACNNFENDILKNSTSSEFTGTWFGKNYYYNTTLTIENNGKNYIVKVNSRRIANNREISKSSYSLPAIIDSYDMIVIYHESSTIRGLIDKKGQLLFSGFLGDISHFKRISDDNSSQ